MKKALLSSHLGYVRNIVLTKPQDEVLAFRDVTTKIGHVTKNVLTASIYHGSFEKFDPAQREYIPILKPHKTIHFKKGNYTLTVEQFLQELGERNKREANISLCADWGFINFHPVKGVWNADEQRYEMPDIKGRDWIDHVPPGRIASHAELKAQYGDKIENRKCFFKIMATRKHLNLNALDGHSFWQFYVRMEGGNWKVVDPGVYAYRFTQGMLDSLWLFGATLRRVLCLMDQNSHYTHRQRGALPMFTTEDEQDHLLAHIQKLMNSEGVFQFLGRNCSYAVQAVTQQNIKNLSNLFFMDVTESTTGMGPVDRVLNWAHHQEGWRRWLILTLLHTVFLSYRKLSVQEETGEMKDYSVKEFFSTFGHNIYNPSYFIHQIEEARKTQEEPFAAGEIYWSHTDEKIFQLTALQELKKKTD